MIVIKVFNSKTGKKIYALVLRTSLRDHFLSFDTGVICEYLDITPSQLAGLDTGEYKGKEM